MNPSAAELLACRALLTVLLKSNPDPSLAIADAFDLVLDQTESQDALRVQAVGWVAKIGLDSGVDAVEPPGQGTEPKSRTGR